MVKTSCNKRFYEEEILRYYPNIKLILFKITTEGLKKLAFGEVDSFLIIFSSKFFMRTILFKYKPSI